MFDVGVPQFLRGMLGCCQRRYGVTVSVNCCECVSEFGAVAVTVMV
jgi:hypothetical protein